MYVLDQMSNQKIKEPRCILCESRKCKKISNSLRDGLESRFPMFPHQCEDCSLIFLWPLMTAEREAKFYTEEYREIYHGGRRYDLKKFHNARQIDSNRRAQMLNKIGLLGTRVLDVGCSTGNFLETISTHTKCLKGIEPDDRQRVFASKLGLDIVRSLSDLDKTEKFDLITVFHVLEHVPDPVTFLATLTSHLLPGGNIVVEVPNVNDVLLSRYRIKEFATFYWHPAHSYYFSPNTLVAVARKARLKASIAGVQRYPIENHLGWMLNRAAGGLLFDLSFLSENTRNAYAADLVHSLTCDTLWMTASAL